MSSRSSTQSSRASMTGSYVRKLCYRNILEELSTIEDDTDNNMECMDKTSKAVKEAKRLNKEGSVEERIRHPGEVYLDSRVLRATSDVTVRCSEAVSGNVNIYDKHELARHIRENPEFWQFTFPWEVPVVGHLFGTFTPEPRAPRAPRRQVQSQQQAQMKAPEQREKCQKRILSAAALYHLILKQAMHLQRVIPNTQNLDTPTRLEKVEENFHARVNRFIIKWYKQHQKPLSYFHTVLDPDSFSKSVENIYHVSFLARDGLISITLDDEYGLPFITPVTSSQQGQLDKSEDKQFIVSMDMQRWQDFVTAFDIRKPMMVLKK